MIPKSVSALALNNAIDRFGTIDKVLNESKDYDAIFPFLYYKMKEKRENGDVFGMAKYMLLTRKQNINEAKKKEFVDIIHGYRQCSNLLKKNGLMLIPEEEGY